LDGSILTSPVALAYTPGSSRPGLNEFQAAVKETRNSNGQTLPLTVDETQHQSDSYCPYVLDWRERFGQSDLGAGSGSE
jgi:hypothetical protein